MIMWTNQISMSVTKKHTVVHWKRTENVATQLENLNVFVLMVTWRMMLEYALVGSNNSCNN